MKRILCTLLICLLFLTPMTTTSWADLTPVANLPTMYIDLEGGIPQERITKETQIPATFSMVGNDIESIVEQPITIKGRGNSTWELPKKPYQIKFDSKTDLLGMGAAKKWILLANYWDKTHIRNAMMYTLANKMNQIFSVECKFVDVVINGEYQGCYLLCEKIEFGGQRIDEDVDDGAVLMELEQQYRHDKTGCDPCLVTREQVHVTLKEPEVEDDFTQNDLNAVKSLTTARLNRIETALAEGYDSYSQMIDVDSFVDWYIQNELAKNYDGAFVTSSFCYLDKDGILHMGPVWDVDVCFGNQDVTYPDSTDNGLNHYNYRSDKGAWYMLLFRDETFVSLLKARWQELMDTGLIAGMFQDIDTFAAQIAPSKALDEAYWPEAMRLTHVRSRGVATGGTPYFTFADELAYLKDWLQKRVAFLNSQWNPNAFTDTPYTAPIAKLMGGDIAPQNFGSVSEGVWSWPERGTVSNRLTKSSVAFFNDTLQKNQSYLVTAQFVSTRSRAQDSLALRLVGYTADGKATTLDTTIATHVTYATAEKDENGFGTLYFPIDLTGYQYESYGLIADAYSAAGSLGEITLLGVPDTPDTPDVPDLPHPPILLGDVNMDTYVNAKDALEVLKFAVAKITLTDPQKTAAEVDGKDSINAKDALEILKFAVKKIEKFPVEE